MSSNRRKLLPLCPDGQEPARVGAMVDVPKQYVLGFTENS